MTHTGREEGEPREAREAQEARLEHLFQEAADLPHSERSGYLDGACRDAAERARVEDLLRHHDADDSLAPPPVPGGLPEAEGAGAIIGRYKLLQKIGEGGFGLVYMAEQQEPVRRRVALKIIKVGMDTREVVARFEAERQALAMMDHPNIARVLDGGATSAGRPYFVMELVRGVSITDYCDKHELSTRERLELFLPVCRAVQHAHQKGVIHRDLKPTNVMVTVADGHPMPKVIDFGIAKAMHTRLTEKTLFTQYQRFIGTPAYMSPEQAELSAFDVDTRTDIYSLGVLLYELLTGSTPFDPTKLIEIGLGEIQRVIREEEPQRPSVRISTTGDATTAAHRRANPATLSKLVRGDLDWICMKALEKERSRRYETANELAADVERHLHDEPVLAGRPSRLYRVRKLLARNRAAVTAGLLVVLTLLGGTIGTTMGMVEAGTQRDAALLSQRDAENSLGFLIDTLALTDPEIAMNPEASIRVVLAGAANRMKDAFRGQPYAEARIRSTIGRAYKSLGDAELAEPQLRRAAELLDELAASDEVEVDGYLHYRTLWTLTQASFLLERPDAFVVAQRARGVAHDLIRASHPDVAEALDRFIAIIDEAARAQEPEPMEEALRRFRNAVEVSSAAVPEGDPLWPILADTYMAGAYNVWYTAHEGRSVALLEEVLRIQRRELPPNHPSLAETTSQLVGVLNRLGQPEKAERRMREAVSFLRQVYPETNFHVALAKAVLGDNLAGQGRFDEAEPLLLEGHAIIATTVPDPATFYRLDSVGRMIALYERWGRENEAERYRGELMKSVYASQTALPYLVGSLAFGPAHAELKEPLAALDRLAAASGYSSRPGKIYAGDLARPLDQLFERWERLLPDDDDRSVLIARWLVGWMNALDPASDSAEVRGRMARRAHEVLLPLADELPHEMVELEATLAVAARARNDDSAALAHSVRALELFRTLPERESWWRTTPKVRIARAFLTLGRLSEAEEILREAWITLGDHLGKNHSETFYALDLLIELYRAWNRPEEAARYADLRSGRGR